jgi:peptidyl-prolyl cis-trans isomerase B (cyclophilin B)
MSAKKDKLHRLQQKQELLAKKEKLKHRRRIFAICVGAFLCVAVIFTLVFFFSEHMKKTSDESVAASSSSSSSESASRKEKIPDKSIAEDKDWNATITTNLGDIKVVLNGSKAPQSVSSFIQLSRDNWWSQGNATCPRLTTGASFGLLQCGAPNGDQAGDPGYTFGPIENAPEDNKYPKGTIAMARTSNNPSSQGSQFFIVYKDTNIPADTVGGYTVFGTVTDGLDVVTNLAEQGIDGSGDDGKPKQEVKIEKVAIE